MSDIERLGPRQAISSHGRFHRWWVLVVLLSVFLGPYSASAYSVVDGRIVDAQGQAVQLRGVNWSGFVGLRQRRDDLITGSLADATLTVFRGFGGISRDAAASAPF